jgi:ribosomal protein L37AE/L43A
MNDGQIGQTAQGKTMCPTCQVERIGRSRVRRSATGVLRVRVHCRGCGARLAAVVGQVEVPA